MAKIIIDNRSDLSDLECLEIVSRNVKLGRISNNGKQYCYATLSQMRGSKYLVWTDLNKKSDRFVIQNDV